MTISLVSFMERREQRERPDAGRTKIREGIGRYVVRYHYVGDQRCSDFVNLGNQR